MKETTPSAGVASSNSVLFVILSHALGFFISDCGSGDGREDGLSCMAEGQ